MTEKRGSGDFSITDVEMSVFVNATEDEEKVERALRNIIPPEITGVKVERQTLKGHYKDPITLITARVRKKRTAKEVFRSTMKGLSSLDQNRLMEEVEDRSDEAGSLYLRLNKQGALRGVRTLVDVDPIRMRFRFRIPHKADPVVVIRASIASIINEGLDTLTPIKSRRLER